MEMEKTVRVSLVLSPEPQMPLFLFDICFEQYAARE